MTLSAHVSSSSSPFSVAHLSDTELHAGTRGLVARSNEQLARLLAHLAEVEARGIHRERACASLCTYCMYELRLPEDTAFRYARIAKLARAFPIVLQCIASGEVHLTGLLLLAPHLTEENHREVLQLAKYRSKREITKLVRRLDPLPDVPGRIEPLGPARTQPPRGAATWGAFMEALSPVRELPLADRPSQWLHLGEAAESEDQSDVRPTAERPTAERPIDRAVVRGTFSGQPQPIHAGLGKPSQAENADEVALEPSAAAANLDAVPSASPLPSTKAAWLDPQRYSVQFTASQEYVDLFERAKDLLSHAVPSRSIEEIHLRAMRLLVAELEKKKFAMGRKPLPGRRDDEAEGAPPVILEKSPAKQAVDLAARKPSEGAAVPHRRGGEPAEGAAAPHRRGGEPAEGVMAPHRRGGEPAEGAATPHRRGADASAEAAAVPRRHDEAPGGEEDGPHGRYVPADVRREVYERDGMRCAYVSADGQRCAETSFLEVHHHDPYARGGRETAENLSIYCRSHNALAAERDFGREYMARRSGRE